MCWLFISLFVVYLQPEEQEANKKARGIEEKLARFKNLFGGCCVFVSRECPRESLTFVIRCFGGSVSWSDESAPASFCSEADERITHQIVDRPLQTHRFLSRLDVMVTTPPLLWGHMIIVVSSWSFHFHN